MYIFDDTVMLNQEAKYYFKKLAVLVLFILSN